MRTQAARCETLLRGLPRRAPGRGLGCARTVDMAAQAAQYALMTVPTTRAPVPASSWTTFDVAETVVWFLRAITSASPARSATLCASAYFLAGGVSLVTTSRSGCRSLTAAATPGRAGGA